MKPNAILLRRKMVNVVLELTTNKDTPRVYGPQFAECLLENLGSVNNSAISILIQERTTERELRLSRSDAIDAIKLKHPPFCPAKQLSKEMRIRAQCAAVEAGRSNTVPVAVSVLAESSDAHLLLTRRAKTLKSFPGVWVTPGGYVDSGETVYEAGLRELLEETGVDASTHADTSKALCCWESVSPPIVSAGIPRRHCLVVYTHVQLNRKAAQLEEFKISPNEVDMIGWIPKEDVKHIVALNREADGKLRLFEKCSGEQSTTALRPIVDGYPLRNLCRTIAEEQQIGSEPEKAQCEEENDSNRERVSTGTRFALEQWLKRSSKL